jgi:hypothetical protein
MDTILLILFVTAGICGVLVISTLIIYAVPVQFAIIYVREKGREESTITVSWGPASCSISHGSRQRVTRILFSGRMIWSRLDQDEPTLTDTAESVSHGPGLSTIEILEIVPPLIGDAGAFLGELYRQSHLVRMTGTLRMGMENPTATGMLYGGYWASRIALNASRIFIEMEPVFGEQVLVLDITMRLRIRNTLALIIPGIALLRNPALRRSFILLRHRTTEAAA